MSEKQDRQGVRNASDLERKYRFGETFAEFMGIAEGAKKTAEDAKAAVGNLDNNLTPEEIFNRLTDNGKIQSIYRDENGNIYVNASYIVAGILRSIDKNTYFDLDEGKIITFNPETGESTLLTAGTLHHSSGDISVYVDNGLCLAFGHDILLDLYPGSNGVNLKLLPFVGDELTEHSIQWKTVAGIPMITDPSAEFSFPALGVNATISELNYLAGVKSAIQAQLDELSNRITALGG